MGTKAPQTITKSTTSVPASVAAGMRKGEPKRLAVSKGAKPKSSARV